MRAAAPTAGLWVVLMTALSVGDGKPMLIPFMRHNTHINPGYLSCQCLCRGAAALGMGAFGRPNVSEGRWAVTCGWGHFGVGPVGTTAPPQRDRGAMAGRRRES